MRQIFPGYFRPTDQEFEQLWKDCIVAVDANVLLNLYRYSPPTRQELEKALSSVKDRLFLPHQAAKEFLRNRLNVTAGQAEEYAKAIKTIKELSDTLSNRKKHPFLPEDQHQVFAERFSELCGHLDAQRNVLLTRLASDEILSFVESTFETKTGLPLAPDVIKALASEGDHRYQNDIPPGYRDGKKDPSGDPYRKYGDLIMWKQIIARGKSDSTPVVFITDDKKEDWWLEQSGRTISPRPELIDEFTAQTGQKFWMYSVEKFVEETSRVSKATVNPDVIAEIVEVREQGQPDETQSPELSSASTRRIHPVLSEDELFGELSEFLASHPSEDGSVGLRYFVVNYLGSQDYEINHSYARINKLAEAGRVEIFRVNKNGLAITRARVGRVATSRTWSRIARRARQLRDRRGGSHEGHQGLPQDVRRRVRSGRLCTGRRKSTRYVGSN